MYNNQLHKCMAITSIIIIIIAIEQAITKLEEVMTDV